MICRHHASEQAVGNYVLWELKTEMSSTVQEPRHTRERGSASIDLFLLAALGWTHMEGHVYMSVWCPAQGHGITACPAFPAVPVPCSPGWDITRRGPAGLWFRKRCTLQGFGFFLPTSPWAWHIQTHGSLNQQEGGKSYHSVGCLLKYKQLLGQSKWITNTLQRTGWGGEHR